MKKAILKTWSAQFLFNFRFLGFDEAAHFEVSDLEWLIKA